MTDKLRVPEVGEFVRGTGRLVEVQLVPPPPQPPPRVEYIFQVISARSEVRRKGKVLDRLETYNDHYGLETSVSSCIEEAKRYVASETIAPYSEIEVVVVRLVNHYRALLDESGYSFYDRVFYKFKPLERGSCWDVPDRSESVVWTSRDPDAKIPEVVSA